ncbi:glutamine-hydrolyzing carbamoyl-phosphate synthase small subunit [Salibacter sp.]|uniref:glutamine-hydrolyzing carbamoyl-phosphate synthase small subunit n=1 Tax=Salibacter sp. TaxID=2010995 RepID=UPI00286FD552|nr:glutamine-hydrolyzing carbamoyl-phosphate synthase small subunit [Salibacter sp.]MDR9398939.1 glutamine-hydrolyzing carbamoyl-phosphate synthase small subunit [Salibacter sp.]MDR9488028.1 glutamine-hydrolyzing carbamoyl-phosphate synthase small subunit [Salibacter sp.]
MQFKFKDQAVLLLEDGTTFYGRGFGIKGKSSGEIAFNTGMTGYQEIFTDPSYFGQILVMTPSHIGNYGIHPEEVESDSVKISGLVCKEISDIYSRPAGIETVHKYFEKNNIAGICDVDTRALVRHIRDKGAMNAIISTDELDIDKLNEMMKEVPSMQGLELSSKVACKEAYEVTTENEEFKVAMLDFGLKQNIFRSLVERGCRVKVFPMTSTLEEIKAWNPDGFMLSNGPGDPAAMKSSIDLVKEILSVDKPVFGICLGHQLMALAENLSTDKMYNGHRGINHPVKNLETGRGEITSQNHGFVVTKESVEKNDDIEVTHIHLNDDTIQGLKWKNKPAFCVQFHPEASAGPNDSKYLFDQFTNLMREHKAALV